MPSNFPVNVTRVEEPPITLRHFSTTTHLEEKLWVGPLYLAAHLRCGSLFIYLFKVLPGEKNAESLGSSNTS